MAILEAKEREERTRTVPLGVPLHSLPENRSDLAKASFMARSIQKAAGANINDPWSEADAKKGSQEPQAWNPMVQRR